MIRYTSFEQFLETCPAEIARQYNQVRALVRRHVPKSREEMKYASPFVTYHGLFLYFAHHAKKKYVIGFCQGSRMQDELNLLRADAKQQFIRHWVLDEQVPLDEDLFGAYLMEAEEIQKQIKPFSKKDRGVEG